MEQQHKLQEEEIARLKQTHQTEIATIRAECKEMLELQMQEVAQVAHHACFSSSLSLPTSDYVRVSGLRFRVTAPT